MIEANFLNLDVDFYKDECLKKYTGFGVGGSAKGVVVPKNEQAFVQTIKLLNDTKQKYKVLGNGSNVLAKDSGYDGYIVITKNALEHLEIKGSSVVCGAGMSLNRLCVSVLEQSLSGLEFAFGIPGTVGGAVFMNAGAYSGEISDVIVSAKVLLKNGDVVTMSKGELSLSYRHSVFHEEKDMIILSAMFELKMGDKVQIKTTMDELMSRRKDKQPLDYKSCGSTFKRPIGGFASKLIEECGLKGVSVGDAEVSTKHSGFIVNKGNATAKDILELVDIVKQDVLSKTGVSLECEVEIL